MLARSILEAIGEEGQIMRKYYQRRLPENPSKDYYYIMRETPNTTSLLIEYGFIDNANDVKKLQNNLLDYAEAVVRAVTRYIGVPYVSPGGVTESTYTVQKGDSLYSIAQMFNTTVAKLRQLNNLTSDTLSIGQVLIVSEETGTNPPSSQDYILYTVKAGDNLWNIARDYETTVDEIVRLNNLKTTSLSVGQTLKIPTKTETSLTYTVKKGDSLWTIANEFNTTVDAIKNANSLTSNTLQIGQQLIIPSSSTTPSPTPPPENNNQTYTVKRGDSLWLIAREFNTTVDAIKSANGLTSNTLQIGQQLIIPGTSTNPTPPEDNTTQLYAVKSGDSLWSIARQFNTTVEAIKSANNLTTNVLQVGQLLRIPGNSETNTPSENTIYTVKSGDSLWKIANLFNTTVDAIIRRNNLTTNTLQIGQQLIIPN